MPTFIPLASWRRFKSIINGVSEDFNKEVLTWQRFTNGLQTNGEDTPSTNTYLTLLLDCLVAYNYFRTWPLTENTKTGAIDKESVVVLLNLAYLANLGYLTTPGNFMVDPGKDYFILGGVEYEPAGETPVSQAMDKPLHYCLILKRKIKNTAYSYRT